MRDEGCAGQCGGAGDGNTCGGGLSGAVKREETFRCRNHCESCGICQVYNGREPVIVYEDYIDGKREFWEIAKEYR